MYLHALLYRSIAGHRVLNVWRARNSFTVSCTIKSDESCTLLCEHVYVERLKLAQSGFHLTISLWAWDNDGFDAETPREKLNEIVN